MQHDSGLEHQLQEIRNRFQRTLHDRALRVSDLWSCLQTGWNEETAKSLYAEIHCLHGSCGTLGFEAIGQIACEIQKLLCDSIRASSMTRSAEIRIAELLGALCCHCDSDAQQS
jgi:HPt (histidine-containing phosphotransfer) domain-containing protein